MSYKEVEDKYNVKTKNETYESEYKKLVQKTFKSPKSIKTRQFISEHIVPLGQQANGRIRSLYRHPVSKQYFRIVTDNDQQLIVSAFEDKNLNELATKHSKISMVVNK